MFRILVRYFKRIIDRQSSLAKVTAAVLILLVFSASGFLYFERAVKPGLTWSDALWWSFVTMTTVGYGDYYPVTPGGRFIVAFSTMIFGISILGYLLSAVAETIIEAKSRELKGMKQIEESGHILIFHFSGLNRMLLLVRELSLDPATKDKSIVIIDDRLSELPQALRDLGVGFVRGNATQIETLERANFSEATHAIILAQDPRNVRSDQLSLAVAMTVEGLHRDIHTIVECVEPGSIEIIRRTGCDSIICGAQFSSNLLVQELLDPGVRDVFQELSSVEIGQKIYVVSIESMKEWSYEELRKWAESRGYLLMGIRRERKVEINPSANLSLVKTDKAIVIGPDRPPEINLG